ncbi:cation transporter [Photobacterium frigidiphilum]|uniref:Cation transporter n=1 Tax=Photobacterium frigidiphilum TaxID=264736 RepID=A0A2T3JCK7_9GAMM|nr:cation transporter [Photobacterium frigidiphilum]PSU46582.1 cation transporter [Photobacterium frigidiphilum]
MTRNIQLERNLLHFSTLFALLFAVMGISLGAWIGSLVIVFDGAYSLVSLFLTLVSVAAASYIHKPRKHPSAINITKVEPMVIAFKGLVITLMCCISFASAIEAILNGGRDVNTGVALIFGVINVLGCIGAYWLMVKKGKRANSGLVDAEAKQWLMDTVISIAVMIGFVLAKILSLTEYQSYAVYADPVMVIIVSIYFIIVPLKMTYEAIQQLVSDQQLASDNN